MKENKSLKWLLILQSFLPLFFLVLIRCFTLSRLRLIFCFACRLFYGDFTALLLALNHPEFFSTVLLFICILMLSVSLLIYLFFNKMQKSGFSEEQESIIIDADATENSAAFFVTYIIPLILDDIGERRGFFSFTAIIIMLILLMRNTNLYYQNPFLTILGYKSFRFHFCGNSNKKYVAITRGNIDATKLIKRKRISDDIYLVYNKN